MADAASISMIFSAFNGMKTITEGLVAVRDISLVSTKVAELNQKIIEAQQGIFLVQQERTALVDRIRTLEKEIADVKAWDAEAERYELKDIGSGILAYPVKPSAQNGEPPHCICPTCYHRRIKSILQVDGNEWGTTYSCHSCSTKLTVRSGFTPQLFTRR